MEVFFYFGVDCGEEVIHSYACLGQGLSELGIEYYSDFPNAKISVGKDFLFKKDIRHPLSEADIVVFHYSLYMRTQNADSRLLRLNQRPRKYITIFIDDSDGLRTNSFRKGARSCDYILKSHYNKKYTYPKNFHPWQFGLCSRVLSAVSPIPYDMRINQILVNFRAKHQLRDYVNTLLSH